MTPNLPDPHRWLDDLESYPASYTVVTVLCVVFLVAALVVFAVAVRR